MKPKYLKQLNKEEENLRLQRRAQEEQDSDWLANTILEDHIHPWMRPE